MYCNICSKGNMEFEFFQNQESVTYYCSINLLLYSLCNLVFNLVSYFYRWNSVWRVTFHDYDSQNGKIIQGILSWNSS